MDNNKKVETVIRAIAHWYARRTPGLEAEDAQQQCWVIYYEATSGNKYDPERGGFIGFVRGAIIRGMSVFTRSYFRSQSIGGDVAQSDNCRCAYTIPCTHVCTRTPWWSPGDDDTVDASEWLSIAVRWRIKNLLDGVHNSEMATNSYLSNKKVKEFADQNSLNKHTVSAARRRARKVLRQDSVMRILYDASR